MNFSLQVFDFLLKARLCLLLFLYLGFKLSDLLILLTGSGRALHGRW